MSQIDAAIDAAKANAANALNTTETLPVIDHNTVPAPAAEAAYVPSLDEAADTARPQVSAYLQVKSELGMRFGKAPKDFFEEIDVILPLDIKTNLTLRSGQNYKRTYDGRTEAYSGANWARLVQETTAADPQAVSYTSADLFMKLVEPFSANKGDLELGTEDIVCLSLSKSGFMEFQQFISELKKIEPDYRKKAIKVKLIARDISSNGNDWAVVSFGAYEFVELN